MPSGILDLSNGGLKQSKWKLFGHESQHKKQPVD